MKHILTALALLFSLNAVADTVSSKEYDVEKRIDSDPRVIEFTPKARPDYVCVYVIGGNNGGLSCFPKKDK